MTTDRDSSARTLAEAAAAVDSAGLGWETGDIRLDPAPKLLELLRRSREVSAREKPEAD